MVLPSEYGGGGGGGGGGSIIWEKYEINKIPFRIINVNILRLPASKQS